MLVAHNDHPQQTVTIAAAQVCRCDCYGNQTDAAGRASLVAPDWRSHNGNRDYLKLASSACWAAGAIVCRRAFQQQEDTISLPPPRGAPERRARSAPHYLSRLSARAREIHYCNYICVLILSAGPTSKSDSCRAALLTAIEFSPPTKPPLVVAGIIGHPIRPINNGSARRGTGRVRAKRATQYLSLGRGGRGRSVSLCLGSAASR